MTTNALIIIILVVVLIIAARGSIKHFKGEGGCCGGGSVVKEPDKKLNGPILKTKTFKIDGMTCENCVNRVKRGINRIDGVSAKVNLRKKQAVVQFEKDVEDCVLQKAIEEMGYKVTSIK
ncbi:heavy-metal-associated domain-containing protein [Butyrivibrio sp. VCB2006]|uniref:heavy-metal-associated domain-containing protein n=1 Tax=Butyrivibrio sp. VCB2006 TaxID=1280679 RepID=UPI000418568F|nr:heavy metal-associated domain-containing protein [Butyrivibrio sp. VCB2006]